jgi:hypothetical protein
VRAHAPRLAAAARSAAVRLPARRSDTRARISSLRVNSNQAASSLFFTHNTALGPPYRVLVDTNFINFSIKNKAHARHASPLTPPHTRALTLCQTLRACLTAAGPVQGHDGLPVRALHAVRDGLRHG